MDLGLTGSRVLVAGAGGLGGGCIRQLLASGADVVAADIRGGDWLDEVGADGNIPGVLRDVVVTDLDSAAACEGLVEKARHMLGGLDVFVHAIGTNARGPVLEQTEADWQRVLTVNLSTAYWLGRAVGRVMCDVGGGRIVFISSVSALMPHEGHGPYAASKGGLNQLMRVMALEWAPHGVTVNAVAPSYVLTPLTRPYLERAGVAEQELAAVPLGRFGVPDDIAGPVLFLASELAGYITGQVLAVDGGRTLV